jgi:hypothetical protein
VSWSCLESIESPAKSDTFGRIDPHSFITGPSRAEQLAWRVDWRAILSTPVAIARTTSTSGNRPVMVAAIPSTSDRLVPGRPERVTAEPSHTPRRPPHVLRVACRRRLLDPPRTLIPARTGRSP